MGLEFFNHSNARKTTIRRSPARGWQFIGAIIALRGAAAIFADESHWVRPDAIAGYIGAGTQYKLKQALLFKYGSSQKTMASIELDWYLEEQNPVNRALAWAGATLEPVVLIAHRNDRQQNIGIYEAAVFANMRWSDFPWNKVLKTTIAIGWGLSYTSDITANEAQDEVNTGPDEGPQRWLWQTWSAFPLQPKSMVFVP